MNSVTKMGMDSCGVAVTCHTVYYIWPITHLIQSCWEWVHWGLRGWGNLVCTAAAKSLQSCLTLCNPRDGSPPGSPIPGLLQVRTLEWVAISFSNAWKWKVKVKLLSCVRPSATPWTAAHQGSSTHGLFQARVLEWGAIAFSEFVQLVNKY